MPWQISVKALDEKSSDLDYDLNFATSLYSLQQVGSPLQPEFSHSYKDLNL